MQDLIIPYLRVCFMLFINAEFLNAAEIDISDAGSVFARTASIDMLYVKRPNDRDFTLHSSAKPMLLCLHKGRNTTVSFYETDAPRTYLTFAGGQINFESFHSYNMAFSVKEGNDVWHFRCSLSANKKTLDVIFTYLSASTMTGTMQQLGDIVNVQLYISTGPRRNPIVRNVEELHPAKYYENVREGTPDEKIFSITPSSGVDVVEVQQPRFVFRTNKFRVEKSRDKVVLELKGFENWYYIIYFASTDQADDFLNHVTNSGRSPNEALAIPSDLRSYLQ